MHLYIKQLTHVKADVENLADPRAGTYTDVTWILADEVGNVSVCHINTFWLSSGSYISSD